MLNLLRQREQRIPSLVQALSAALETVRTCSTCGAIDECDPCLICSDDRRDHSLICVVADVADVWAMERSRSFRGTYHVLNGTPSHRWARAGCLTHRAARQARVADDAVKEIISPFRPPSPAKTTAHYVAERLGDANVTITCLAQGIPMGGELDYMDDGTLSAALSARVSY